MAGLFTFLQQNPYLLLFFVVGLAVWIGRVNVGVTGSAWWREQ